MTNGNLQNVLTQSFDDSDDNFWSILKDYIEQERPLKIRLTSKVKQNISLAIRTSLKNEVYTNTIISFLERLKYESNFAKCFSKNDTVIFETLTYFTKEILFDSSKSNEIKLRLMDVMHYYIDENEIFYSSMSHNICDVLISFINTKKKGDCPLIKKALSFIYSSLEDQNVKELVRENNNLFYQILLSSFYPLIQLQILEIFWRLEHPIGDKSFSQCNNDNFIDTAHEFLKSVNESIIYLSIKTMFYGDYETTSGWLDIGIDSVLICTNDFAVSISFDIITGLETDGTNFIFSIDGNVEELSLEGKSTISFIFNDEMSESLTKKIFDRVSKGESSNSSQTCTQLEESHYKPISHHKSNIKSSIAIYVPPEVKNNDNKFDIELTNIFDKDFKLASDKAVNEKRSSYESNCCENLEEEYDLYENEEEDKGEKLLPPIMNIVNQTESESLSENCSSPILRPFLVNDSSSISKHTSQVSSCIENGFSYVTKRRMEDINTLNETLKKRVDLFKEEIQSDIKSREQMSVKLLETEKQKFQDNIQVFKKQESVIHQKLIDYEERLKTFALDLNSLQTSMRHIIQNHKENLEKELSELRNSLRKEINEE